MAAVKVIVFGPTGNVGIEAARTAQKHGAKVFLAMRDTSKVISTLGAEQEAEGGFERVQADLSNPQTITAAIKQTRATRAFIYIAWGTPDNMRSSIEALRSAGVDFVAFLSTSDIQTDIREVQPEDYIAWAHAQIEVNLEEVFGRQGYVTVRPGYFASNSLWWKKMINEGEVKIVYPDARFDWITPQDMGAVCGTFLAKGPQGFGDQVESNSVYLYGPDLVSQRDALAVIGRAIGRDVKITELNEQEGAEMYMKEYGTPEPAARRLMEVMRGESQGNGRFYSGPSYQRGKENVEKYSGRQPLGLQQWVEGNKHRFSG